MNVFSNCSVVTTWTKSGCVSGWLSLLIGQLIKHGLGVGGSVDECLFWLVSLYNMNWESVGQWMNVFSNWSVVTAWTRSWCQYIRVSSYCRWYQLHRNVIKSVNVGLPLKTDTTLWNNILWDWNPDMYLEQVFAWVLCRHPVVSLPPLLLVLSHFL